MAHSSTTVTLPVTVIDICIDHLFHFHFLFLFFSIFFLGGKKTHVGGGYLPTLYNKNCSSTISIIVWVSKGSTPYTEVGSQVGTLHSWDVKVSYRYGWFLLWVDCVGLWGVGCLERCVFSLYFFFPFLLSSRFRRRKGHFSPPTSTTPQYISTSVHISESPHSRPIPSHSFSISISISISIVIDKTSLFPSIVDWLIGWTQYNPTKWGLYPHLSCYIQFLPFRILIREVVWYCMVLSAENDIYLNSSTVLYPVRMR